jgi:uncharacterized membrane protein (DUF2068 family)
MNTLDRILVIICAHKFESISSNNIKILKKMLNLTHQNIDWCGISSENDLKI